MRFLVFVITIFPLVGLAQSRNCCQAPTFSVDDLPEAKPYPGIGNSHLEITTVSDSAQFYVDHGLNWFHSFYYYEAFMAFRKAARLDSMCAMCHTLATLTLNYMDVYDSEEFEYHVNKAYDLFGNDTLHFYPYERQLMRAEIKPNYTWNRHRDTMIYNGYKGFYKLNPQNPETLAFLILYLDDGFHYDGKFVGRTGEAVELSEKVDLFPESSSLQHYYIHLFEDCCPDSTLKYAGSIAELAPKNGHITHMPGHAYYYNGMYDSASQAFINSYYVDSTYIAKRKYARKYNWNILHNLQFLVLSLVEEGKYEQALKWQSKLDKLAFFEYPEGIQTEVKFAQVAKVQIPWRFFKWNDCIEASEELSGNTSDYWQNSFYFDGLKIFFEGRKAFDHDQLDSLELFADRLKSHTKSVKKYAKDHDYKYNKGDAETELYHLESLYALLDFMNENKEGLQDNYDIIFDKIMIELHDANYHEPHLFVEDPYELLAEVLDKHGEYDVAAQYLEKALLNRPNAGVIHINLARMYYKSGQRIKALEHLNKFNEAWLNADKDLIQFEMARVLQIDLAK